MNYALYFWKTVLASFHVYNFHFFVVVFVFFFSKTPIFIVMAFMCKSTHTSAIVANDYDQIEIHSFDYMCVYNFTLWK